MKDLIRHFMRYPENLTGLRNCHAKGVDSILLDAPNTKFRVFIANEGNNLWKNSELGTEIMSVGFHNHHCDVELISIYGYFFNLTCKTFLPFAVKDYSIYEYQSKISGKYLDGKFSKIETCGLHIDSELIETNSRYNYPNKVFMSSDIYHTILVPEKEKSAWLVIEGEENLNYKPITISNNHNLENEKFEGYYEKMESEECLRKLEEIL